MRTLFELLLSFLPPPWEVHTSLWHWCCVLLHDLFCQWDVNKCDVNRLKMYLYHWTFPIVSFSSPWKVLLVFILSFIIYVHGADTTHSIEIAIPSYIYTLKLSCSVEVSWPTNSWKKISDCYFKALSFGGGLLQTSSWYICFKKI